MQVAITCRHGQIPDDTRDYLTRKSEKLLKYFERVTAIEVTIDFSQDRVCAELLVNTEHKYNFVARDEGEDVVSTYDGAFHKMEHQIKKYKQKIQDHRRDRRASEIDEDHSAEGELGD